MKRWRYVGVFCDELMACAARVRVGPAVQSFWAVYERPGALGAGRLRERTHVLTRRQAVELAPGRVRVRDAGVLLDLTLEEDEGIEARCAHGRGRRVLAQAEGVLPQAEGVLAQAEGSTRGAREREDGLAAGEVWTRKQAGIRAHGTLALDGGPAHEIEALAVVDDTAGYHARHTEWWWSAGVGSGEDGTPLAWNLVQGINDPPSASERAVWVAGAPSEPGPVRFVPDLSELVAEDGSRLCFTPEAGRRRRENLLIVRSEYTAPFGAFTGTLPGGVRLASGLGVMEHHRARW